MKSTQIEKNKWEKINKIVLRVDNVDLIYKQDVIINFVCGFENISRGRCVLLVKEKNKKQIESFISYFIKKKFIQKNESNHFYFRQSDD